MKKYIVRPGDTMWAISKATGVRLNLLIAANPQVQDPNQLQPGGIIAIPELHKSKSPELHKSKSKVKKSAKPSTGDVTAADKHYFGFVWSHTVAPNETWGTIASHYGVTVDQLHVLNPKDAAVLKPGDVVYIPSISKGGKMGAYVKGMHPAHGGGMAQYSPGTVPTHGGMPQYGPGMAPMSDDMPEYGPGMTPMLGGMTGYGHDMAQMYGDMPPYDHGMMPMYGAGMPPYSQDAVKGNKKKPPIAAQPPSVPMGTATGGEPAAPLGPGADTGPHSHYPHRRETLRNMRDPYSDIKQYYQDGTHSNEDEWLRGDESWPESMTWDTLVDTPWDVPKSNVQFGGAKRKTSSDKHRPSENDGDNPQRKG